MGGNQGGNDDRWDASTLLWTPEKRLVLASLSGVELVNEYPDFRLNRSISSNLALLVLKLLNGKTAIR